MQARYFDHEFGVGSTAEHFFKESEPEFETGDVHASLVAKGYYRDLRLEREGIAGIELYASNTAQVFTTVGMVHIGTEVEIFVMRTPEDLYRFLREFVPMIKDLIALSDAVQAG